MDKNTSPHENELKSLLPDPVTGSQTANDQLKNIQTQLQQPVITQLEKIPGPTSEKLLQQVNTMRQQVNTMRQQVNNNKNKINNYLKTKQHRLILINMVVTLLVILGALNWGAHVMDVNLVEIVSQLLNNLVARLFGRNYNIRFNIIIYALVFTSAVILASQKITWLPFLGQTVLPSPLLPLKKPVYFDTNISVKAKPNSKVVYWASLPNSDTAIPFVSDAYGDFSNSGVVMADTNGLATLPLLKGSSYIVPSGRQISRHVHWRVVNENGMLGPVRTQKY
jgi:uncharacterized membrane protein YuzA (DUF378 family)